MFDTHDQLQKLRNSNRYLAYELKNSKLLNPVELTNRVLSRQVDDFHRIYDNPMAKDIKNGDVGKRADEFHSNLAYTPDYGWASDMHVRHCENELSFARLFVV